MIEIVSGIGREIGREIGQKIGGKRRDRPKSSEILARSNGKDKQNSNRLVA